MSQVVVKFKNGTERRFPDFEYQQGEWGFQVVYEGAFLIVRDRDRNTNSFPAEDVREVVTKERRSW